MALDTIALITALAAAGSAAAAWATALQSGSLARSAEARKQAEERASIAGAILGEIEAYIELLDPPRLRENLDKLRAITDEAKLKSAIALFPTLPSTHPVFDQVAAHIGLLPGDLPKDISKLYNIVTGFRLIMQGLGRPVMSNAPVVAIYTTIDELLRALTLGESLYHKAAPELMKASKRHVRPWGSDLH